MSNVSILVVDDDDDVRTALCDELSPQYAVTAASGAVEAFAALSACRFDVIISDLRMPEHDGIEVLDFARDQQLGIIRILLTGYGDERAHAALMAPDAPYKVGKPWHDEIEVILTRALEQRRRVRLLAASLESAYSLNQVEAALADTHDLGELGEAVVLRAGMVDGVDWCGCVLDGAVLHGRTAGVTGDGDGAGWRLDLAVDGEGRLQVIAGGHGDEARELVTHIVHLSQRRSGLLTASATAWALDAHRPRRSRLDELVRQATLGAMAGTLIHDVAGIMQSVECAIGQVAGIAADRGDPELIALADDLSAASEEAVELFVELRKFMRDGKPTVRELAADELIQRSLRQVGGAVRERAGLRVAAAPGVMVRAAGALCVHVFSAVLQNAAAASPSGGFVDVAITVAGDDVIIAITDDGPGVRPELAGLIFDAQVWQRPGGVGTGLAIAAHAVKAQGGAIGYHRAPGRGACFTVTLPRA